MSILNQSSVETQYQNTSKNTVEISDIALQAQKEQRDKLQVQLSFEQAIEKDIKNQESEILKKELLDRKDTEIDTMDTDLQVFKKSLAKLLSTHFRESDSIIKFSNNGKEFDTFWDFCIDLRNTEKDDIEFLKKLTLGIHKIPTNAFGISFDAASKLWWLNCSGAASLFQSIVEISCNDKIKSYLTTPYWHACNIVEVDDKTYFFDSRNGNFSDISTYVSCEKISETIKIWRLNTPIPWISRTTFPAYVDSKYARTSNYIWNIIAANELVNWTLPKDDILNNIPIEQKEKIKKEAQWFLNLWSKLPQNELEKLASFFSEINKIAETDIWYNNDRKMLSWDLSLSLTDNERNTIKTYLQYNRENILQFIIDKNIKDYNFWEEGLNKKILEYKKKLHDFWDIVWINDKQRYEYINTLLNNKKD